MKKILLFICLFILGIYQFAVAQPSDLFISEYIEGSSLNKALELYNGTGSSIDLSANSYTIEIYANGSSSPNTPISLSGTVADGDVFVLSNNSANSTILAEADQTSGSVSFSGNDAVVLKKGTTILDVIGQIGTDPGSEWGIGDASTANNTIVRKSTICEGDTNGDDAFDPATEWDGYPSDTFSYIGSHTANCSSGPSDPTSFTATTVSATQINLIFSPNGNSDNVIIVYDTENTFTTPSGTPPATGQSFAGGTLLYNGTSSPYNHTGLTEETHYYYQAWSISGTDYSTGLTDDATTLKGQSTNHVNNFSASAGGSSSINITWTENDGTVVPDGYLIKASTLNNVSDPTDGVEVGDNTTIGNDDGAINLLHGTSSYQWTGLSSETTYHFKIFPYTNSSTNIDYKIDGAPLTNSTTQAGPITLNSEDFSSGFSTWTAYSVASDKDWSAASGYAEANGYGGNASSDDWLISPVLNLNNYDGEVLTFTSYKDFSGGSLIVKISSDYNGSGNPNSYTWTTLSPTLATTTSWTPSGDVDISGYSGGNCYIAFHYTSGTTAGTASLWRVDDIQITGLENVPNPTSFSATPYSTSQIDLAFSTNGNGDNIVIVFDTDNSFTTPSGVPPAVGQTFSGGTILYNGTGSSYNHTSLNPGTDYYYKAWSYESSSEEYSSGVTDNARTLKIQPDNHVTDFTVTAISADAINLTWSANDGSVVPDGYLIKASTLNNVSNPSDGAAVGDNLVIGNDDGAKNINHGINSYQWTGLTFSTTYYFKIYPYTNSGTDINYKVTGAPEGNATTDAVTASITVSLSSLYDFGDVYAEHSSTIQHYTVSAEGLTQDLAINPPSGFEVSTSYNSGYASSLSLTPSGGSVSNTIIYARLTPPSTGSYSGNITHSCTGATTQNVSVAGTCIASTIPTNYYATATGTGYTLKTQLHNIIDDHNIRGYDQLWIDFQTTDENLNGKVWDMYSNIPESDPPEEYEFTFSTDQCGIYSIEGDCYNREHSFPKSWFNDASPMYSDLFHLYPTDGKVNGLRSNYAFGEVSSPTTSSINGCEKGDNTYGSYSGIVFEPIDEFKGDFARTYFYMATRYEDIISNWETNDQNGNAMLDGSSDKVYDDWALDMLLEWHTSDPVSQKEINRNHAVYGFQGNRNPFIDHPEYISMIWAVPTTQASNFSTSNITSTSMTANWTRGNGDKILVLARAGGAVDADPTPGKNYTANATFGVGDEVGSNNFVIYNGTGTSVSITNLLENRTYYYAIYEYDENAYSYNLTQLTGSGATPTALPVDLISFYADINPGQIYLHWATASEFNNAGFYVYRDGEKLSDLILGQGTTEQTHYYSFLDNDVEGDVVYSYLLADVEEGTNKKTFHQPISVVAKGDYFAENPLPQKFALYDNTPNPFNPTTLIKFDIPRQVNLNLKVYDLNGRLVKVLIDNQIRDAGQYSVEWNGIDDSGRSIGSGVYFYSLHAEVFEEMKSMVLIK